MRVLPSLALGAEPPAKHVLDRPPARGHLLDRSVFVRAFGILGPVEATMALGAFVSARFGRFWFWVMLLVPALVVLFVHAWVLPSKGINGWTGEPKEKYYALRGWKLPQ